MTLNSSIYVGQVRHCRFRPKEHAFRYRLFMMCFDLSEIDTVFKGRWFWSTRRAALARYKRENYLGDRCKPLKQEVEKLVLEKTGKSVKGKIFLLTHLQYFGYCFNPVSFYYCYGPSNLSVEFIVVEITNTPWGEKYCYVFEQKNQSETTSNQHEFNKEFHVSPFMPMNMQYSWSFSDLSDNLQVTMRSLQHNTLMFDASLKLAKRPITTHHLAKVLILYPAMTFKVIVGIYYQALILKLKGIPFFSHPKNEWEIQEGDKR